MVQVRLNSLFTQQQMGTWWQHWEDEGGGERNWPPYLTCWWLRKSVLSNRHSPTHESIQDYLYLYHEKNMRANSINYTKLISKYIDKYILYIFIYDERSCIYLLRSFKVDTTLIKNPCYNWSECIKLLSRISSYCKVMPEKKGSKMK